MPSPQTEESRPSNAADKAVRHTVAVAIELQADVFVNESFDRVAMIGRDDRQGAQNCGLKSVDGALAGFPLPLVGDFGAESDADGGGVW
jgi:hypothetical protein